ncbi:transcript cleavage factor [Candidatus Aerophobetes bacterium]|uniref:Transcript cleavage factor n=1 Tax=Aerophobetes bacterium TaxID=2030807 RepID=A0A2A4X584_UNCAE|nr:MAG: transcript cleavage factor [Candidatus Aerophobetes bacterium]
MGYLDQFKQHLQNQDFTAFCELWEEYCQGDEVNSQEFKTLLELLLDSPFKKDFGQVVTEGIPLLEKLDDKHFYHSIFSLIVDLQTTNSPDLAEQIITFLKEQYPVDENFQLKMRLVGLKDKLHFQSSIKGFKLLSHLKPGKFIFHRSGWGVGEIMEVSFLREEVQLDLDLVRGRKTLSFENAFKTLTPLKDDHFLSQRFGNPDTLEEKAKKDPLYAIHLLLKDLGSMSAQEMKEELLDLVIPESDWNKWWQTARSKLKKDPKITTPTKAKGPFILHNEDLTHDERILRKIEKNASPEQFIDLVYAFLRDFPQAAKNAEVKSAINSYVEKALNLGELSDAKQLAMLFLLDEVTPGIETARIQEKIKHVSSINHLITHMDIAAYKRKILRLAVEVRENAFEEIMLCLLALDPAFIKDFSFQLLMENKQEDLVKKALDTALLTPKNHGKTIAWYLHKISKESGLPMTTDEHKGRFFEALLIVVSHLEKNPEEKAVVKKIVQMITGARFKLVRDIFKFSSIEQVQELVLLATKCLVFTDQDIEIFHSLARVVYPSLKTSKKNEPLEEEELTTWATQEGYRAMGEKIKHLSTVETVENAREIEQARAHGDLRENAEFKASLERRDRLQSELEFLSKQYNQARILRKEDVKTDSINVGVVITCKSNNGSETTYTILGPFEADIEKNIISSQSKMAQSLIGKKTGERVSIRNEELTITSLRNYFN